jgi:hypothetical protein
MTSTDAASRTCPWCSAVATNEATTCGSCGAALAQRETLGDVAIAGLTAVHPALLASDGRPIHLAGPSPSQGVANGVIAAAMIGGPVGLLAVGGMAAVVAAEYAGARHDGIGGAPADLDSVGRPSELALLALERAEAEGAAVAGREADPDDTPASAPDPWRDLPSRGEPGA